MTEVVVNGESFLQAEATHQDEGRAVGEAVRLIRARNEELPGGPFVHGFDAGDRHELRIPQDVAKANGRPVTEARLAERKGLVEDEAGGDEPALETVHRGTDTPMSGVARVQVAQPRAGGDEETLHRRFFGAP